MSRYDLTEFEWRVIAPLLPTSHEACCVLNDIFWVLRSGSPWRDLPERCGAHTTCYNRCRRWTKAGVSAVSLRPDKKPPRIDVLDEAGAVLLQRSTL